MNQWLALSDQIRIMRTARNLNQTQLAERAGLSLFQISYFECGHALPTPKQEQAIKEALAWPERADEAFYILVGNGEEPQEG